MPRYIYSKILYSDLAMGELSICDISRLFHPVLGLDDLLDAHRVLLNKVFLDLDELHAFVPRAQMVDGA